MERQTQDEEYLKNLKVDLNQAKIAGTVSIVSALSSIVFPPAIGGVLVGIEEVFRNGRNMELKIRKHNSEKKIVKAS